VQTAAVDPGVLGARLRQQEQIDDPVIGTARPLELEARSALWPHARQWVRIELTALLENGARRVEEYRFTPAMPSPELPSFSGPALPVAIVFERTPNGASRARLYSVQALAPARARVLAVDTHLQPALDGAEVLARYFAALQAADLAATLECFDAQGTLQDFDGAIYRGHAQLREVFVRRYARGGVRVRCCSRLNDGARSALELEGTVQTATGQAGAGQESAWRPALLVCERSPGGALAAARLYR
jgi:SnoaL-like domain